MRLEFYHWACTLKRIFRFIGTIRTKPVWIGYSKLMQLSSFHPVVESPTAFSADFIPAQMIAGSGMVVQSSKVFGIPLKCPSSSHDIWCYGDIFDVKKMYILSMNHEENALFIKQYLQNMAHSMEDTMKIFCFAASECKIKDYIVDLISSHDECTQMSEYKGLSILQRVFFEWKCYWIVDSVWNDQINSIEKCSKEQILYVLDNYIFPNIDDTSFWGRYYHEIMHFIKSNRLSGAKLAQYDSFKFSQDLIAFINEQETQRCVRNIAKEELIQIMLRSIKECEQDYLEIDGQSILRYMENQENMDAHRLYTMKRTKFRKLLKRKCNIRPPVSSKLYDILHRKLHYFYNNVFVDLHHQIINCQISQVPITRQTLLEFLWDADLHSVDTFHILIGAINLKFDEKTGCFNLKFKNEELVRLYPPQTYIVKFYGKLRRHSFESCSPLFWINILRIAESPKTLRYAVTMRYFTDGKHYEVHSGDKQTKITQEMMNIVKLKSEELQNIKILHSKRSNHCNERNLKSVGTIQYGNTLPIGGEWIFDEERNQSLTGMRVWSTLHSVTSLCIQINGKWQRMNGNKDPRVKLDELILDKDEYIVSVVINHGEHINALHFYTSKGNTVGGGHGIDLQSISKGVKLSGIKICANDSVIKSVQFKWLQQRDSDLSLEQTCVENDDKRKIRKFYSKHLGIKRELIKTEIMRSAQETNTRHLKNLKVEKAHKTLVKNEQIENNVLRKQRMDEDVDKILKKMADKKQKSMYRNIMTFDKMEQRLNVFYENNGDNEYFDDDNVGKLGKWMKMNQFDVDDIESELKLSHSECMLVDFDKEFPVVPSDLIGIDRRKQIYNLLTSFWNDQDVNIENKMMTKRNLSLLDFFENELEESDYLKAQKIALTQCPKIFAPHGGEEEVIDSVDELLALFAIGIKNERYPLLMHLIDTYLRDRIKNRHQNNYTLQYWASVNHGMNLLKNSENDIDPNKMIKGMDSFFQNVLNPLPLNPISKFSDNLLQICQYLVVVSDLIGQKLHKNEWNAPLQIDLIIAIKQNVDTIGDVIKRFEETQCDYVAYSINSQQNTGKILSACYEKFESKLRKKHCAYPNKKRFCIFIDRREHKELQDEIILFDPPNDCNSMPMEEEHVYEWFLNSSLVCVIPDATKKNIITTKTVCNGLMTFSFHIESVHEIRCYMYMNGAMTRFHPRDAINLFSEFFDNSKCAQNKQFEELIAKLEANIVDWRFDAFYEAISPCLESKSFANNNDLDLDERACGACAFLNALKEGYMQKEDKSARMWRKWYFVLDAKGYLSYYRHKYSSDTLETINMRQCIKFKSFDGDDALDWKFGIKIYTKQREWNIACCTNKERREWLGHFTIVTKLKP